MFWVSYARAHLSQHLDKIVYKRPLLQPTSSRSLGSNFELDTTTTVEQQLLLHKTLADEQHWTTDPG
jgi:hypothetical protein